ncbi:MAG: efflux RND transporter periplasmic adaptor subunit [Bacteroidales bacterium]
MRKSFLAVIVMLSLFGCGSKETTEKSQDSTQTSQEAELKKPVKVSVINRETIQIEEQYTATINAYDKVFLAPNMPGRIKDVKVEVNDFVRRGQRVVDMDNSQLIQLEVNFENVKKELQRMDTLIKYGSISQQSYDQTKASYDATKANLTNLRENTVLNSPFSGIITARYYDDNEIYSGSPNTTEGKAAIVVIESINKLKVEVNMSERFYPTVKKGQKARLTTDIYANEKFEGSVSLVYPTIDPDTRTFTVEITIPNGDLRLRPGMFARVNINLGEESAIVVPSAAVLMLDGTNKRYVFLEKGGKAEYVEVQIGTRFDDKLEIISDKIKEGDNLIVSGQINLNNGDLLKVTK